MTGAALRCRRLPGAGDTTALGRAHAAIVSGVVADRVILRDTAPKKSGRGACAGDGKTLFVAVLLDGGGGHRVRICARSTCVVVRDDTRVTFRPRTRTTAKRQKEYANRRQCVDSNPLAEHGRPPASSGLTNVSPGHIF